MEPISYITIAFLISLAGNLLQFNHAQDLKADSDRWQEVATSNYNEWKNVIEVNKNNDSVMVNIETALNECSQRYDSAMGEINDFRAVKEIQNAAIEELQESISDSIFATCRVPDWVSLEGVTATESGD